ncbi:MAG: tetratricopeptide repeat protein [Candidatus Latescibacteria bacterium]|nr:tetratricopeptide repeat protein [Candidatus Latescibacterota bacterium]NIM22022.1 tetratricopeptide repeat protein [Candidatus Latescibacterota bacterium]NIM66040.1 tetratricopeptide repeat protein [Candidatus Latescibacterota bacterium]NIO02448.1 tetratricopeptide repeat protein [Candidatus Latescibacterota bacterium]NIO29359.1 tetratricopeptide repeat protein [Candidatus Latescibacterota bacterium]
MRKSSLIYFGLVWLVFGATSVLADSVPKPGVAPAFTSKADVMLSTAETFIRARDYEKALAVAEDLAKVYSNYAPGWMILGHCRSLAGEFEASNEAYETALSIGADANQVYNRMAYNHVKMEEWAKARHRYEAILDLDHTDVNALVQHAYIDEKLNNFEDAIVFCKKALDVKPSNTKVIAALARIEAKRGEKSEARFWLKKGLEVDPESKLFLNKLSVLLINEQSYEEALPHLEKLLVVDPDNPAIHRNVGIAYYGLSKKKEAKEAFEVLRRTGGKMNGLYGPLAESYRATGEKAKAMAVVKEGIREKDQVAWLYCIWGKLLEESENYDGAIDKFKKAAELREKPWTGYAEKQIARQIKLKKRAELMAAQGGGK